MSTAATFAELERSDTPFPGGQESVPLDVRSVSLDLIDPNPRQPRTTFDEDALAELAASIEQVGVLQPVAVRVVGSRYELIMGERRVRASRLAGRTHIPAIVRETADSSMLRDALLENIQRSALNPLEEAAGYAQLIDDYAMTHEDVAETVGKSRSHVSHTLALLRLPAPVQRRVAAGVLSAGHAKILVGIPDPGVAAKLAERIVAEGLSVHSCAELVAQGNLPGWEEDQPRPRRPRPARPEPSIEVASYADELGDHLDTRVKIETGKSKGRIVIEFAGMDDLARVMAALRTLPSH